MLRHRVHDATCEAWLAHKGPVQCMTSLDSTCAPGMFATGGSDSVVKIWSPWAYRSNGQRAVTELNGHAGTVLSLVPYKGVLISSSTDGTVLIWRASGGKNTERTVFEPIQKIRLKAWIPVMAAGRTEGPQLFLGDGNGRVHFWSPARDGEAAVKGEWEKATSGRRDVFQLHKKAVTGMDISCKFNLLFTISRDGMFKVFELRSGILNFEHSNPNRCRYTAITWVVPSQELVLGDEKGQVQVWKPMLEKMSFAQNIATAPITSITPGLDEDTIHVVVEHEIGIREFKIARQSREKRIEGHTGAIIGLFTEQDLSGGQKAGETELPPRSVESKGSEFKGPATAKLSTARKSESRRFQEAAEVVRDKGSRLYSCALDASIRSWDQYDDTCKAVMSTGSAEVSCIVPIPWASQPTVITGHEDGSQRAWNIPSGTCSVFRGHKNTVTGMCIAETLNNEDQILVSSSYDGTVCAWELVMGAKGARIRATLQFTARVANLELFCIAYCRATHALVVGCNSPDILEFSMRHLKTSAPWKGHKESVSSIVVDGKMAISGSDDGSVLVWDATRGLCVSRLEGHTAAITTLVHIKSLGLLGSAAEDRTALFWDYASNKNVARFQLDANVRCIALNQAKEMLMVGLENGRIVFLPIPPTPPKQAQERKGEVAQLPASLPSLASLEGMSAAQLHAAAGAMASWNNGGKKDGEKVGEKNETSLGTAARERWHRELLVQLAKQTIAIAVDSKQRKTQKEAKMDNVWRDPRLALLANIDPE